MRPRLPAALLTITLATSASGQAPVIDGENLKERAQDDAQSGQTQRSTDDLKKQTERTACNVMNKDFSRRLGMNIKDVVKESRKTSLSSGPTPRSMASRTGLPVGELCGVALELVRGLADRRERRDAADQEDGSVSGRVRSRSQRAEHRRRREAAGEGIRPMRGNGLHVLGVDLQRVHRGRAIRLGENGATRLRPACRRDGERLPSTRINVRLGQHRRYAGVVAGQSCAGSVLHRDQDHGRPARRLREHDPVKRLDPQEHR